MRRTADGSLRPRRTRKAIEERLSTQLASDAPLREADLPCGWSLEALQERLLRAVKGMAALEELPSISSLAVHA